MAGGIGSRFWPMSRNSFPKQFLDILGTGRTLIQQTFERLQKVCPAENIFVVTNEAYVDLVREQLPQIPADRILGEPYRKNTAPCIAYATAKISAIDPDANIVVAPSDHVITKEDEFIQAITKALEFTAGSDNLLTLGIKPSRPDTGYGYIQFIDDKAPEKNKIYKVKTFTEKPDLEMAKFFLKTGEFLWNAGIFIWSARAITKVLETYLPEIESLFRDASSHFGKPTEQEQVKMVYEHCTNISIDFGVMEKARNVHVMSADFGWSDLGTYGSLYEHIGHDDKGNAVVGKNVMTYDSSNCMINVPKDKLVVVQGLKDFIVVESDGVLLICKKKDEQQIKQFVNDVKLNKGDRFV